MTGASQERRFLAVMLAPAFALFTVFVAWPAVRALIYSVQKWDGFRTPEFVGLQNFRNLFADDLFIRALSHNLVLMIGGGGITIVLALFFASLLHRRIRGANFFRVAFFFPNVISAVAIALLWLLLYSTTEFGMINAMLQQVQRIGWAFGLDALDPPLLWGLFYGAMHVDAAETVLESLDGLGLVFGFHGFDEALPFPFTDSRNLIYSLVPMMVWTATGFYMVLFLAAMEGIPEEYYEAARLDGASPIAQFWHVTLPMIREVLVVGVVFIVISSAKFFDAVWVIESQFPTKDSHVMATVLYQKVFTEYNVGYAAAVAVMLFLIVFVLTLITFRFSRREVVEY